MYYVGNIMCDPNYLEHHGILGMKWGVRRYQNEDGTLTSAGKARYGAESQAKSRGFTKAAGTGALIAGSAAVASMLNTGHKKRVYAEGRVRELEKERSKK